jgi:3-hydroxyacyl-CoA dehydrogenase
VPFDANATDVRVGVVGTGAMGRGIMQVAAQGSMRVVASPEGR